MTTTINPNWQPGDPIYQRPNAGYNRQPLMRLKDDSESAAPARWPEPFIEDLIDIIVYPQSELGYFA